MKINNEHFIGSIVNIPTPSIPAGVNKFLLIDGQQQMTTLFVVMMVLRDIARLDGDDELADEINDMIVNRHKKGDDHYKLMPTQADRIVYKELVEGKAPNPVNESGLQGCYRFFKQQVARVDRRSIFEVISGRLSIVSIVLDPNDNPHVVFESLNAKGRSLSQADLIRNYFFMRIHIDQHEQINAEYWQPMQVALGDNMTEFIRHYLMRTGTSVRQPDVYQVIKQRFEAEKVDASIFLQRMAKFGFYYQRILFPNEYETDDGVRKKIQRLNTLKVTVAYPFLLNIYEAVESGTLNQQEFYDVLDTLENYLFRRAICGVPTSELNKIFPSLYGSAMQQKGADFITALRSELQRRGYPRDDEFIESLISEPLYGGGDRITRTRFLLETLERSYGHKEIIDLSTCSIEHILPQTLDPWWQQHLGKSYDEVKETWLHTLGNLTLTAYNTELSNRPFPDKQQRFKESNLQLNKTLPEFKEWGGESINQRANMLAQRALELWSDFRPTDSKIHEADGDVSGSKPYQVTIMGQPYTVKSWADVLRQTVWVICDLTPEKMEDLKEAFPRWISDIPFKRSEPLSNGMFLNINWNPTGIYRACRRMAEFIGIDKDEWTVLVE